jgi:hypothetical protein
MTERDFDRLVAAWLDGRLNAEESRELQQELRESAAARSQFLKYSRLEVALHELADTSGMLDPEKLLASVVQSDPRHAPELPSAKRVDAKRQPAQATLPRSGFRGQGGSPLGRLAAWCGAIAVGVLLAISLLSSSNEQERGAGPAAQVGPAAGSDRVEVPGRSLPRKPPAPVATLASAERALWEDSQLEVGQALYEGDSIRLQQGEARISVGFGAEIVADAPCSLTFLASDRVQLHQGEVAVDVAPWAKGFTVVTKEMDIVDLGTTFTVSASPGIKSETTVLKGVVRVHPSKVRNEPRRGLLVTEGQQVSVDESGLLKNAIRKETLQLLRRLDFGVSGPYRPVVLNNSGLGLAVGDEDLHWRVVAGPEGDFAGAQFATVCVPHERYLPNDPQASQWISIADWQTAAPNSIYTFQTEFDLEGYDLTTMQLFGRFLADNGIAAVRVNGASVQVQSWVDNVKMQPFGDPQFRFVNITEGLVKGRNVIEVDVRNGMMTTGKGEGAKMSVIPNPMALRVEWYAFGRQYSLAKVSDRARQLLRLRTDAPPKLAVSGSRPGI